MLFTIIKGLWYFKGFFKMVNITFPTFSNLTALSVRAMNYILVINALHLFQKIRCSISVRYTCQFC